MSDKKSSQPTRRKFLQRGLLTAAGISALGVTRSGRAQVDSPPWTRGVALPPRLPLRHAAA